MFFSSGDIPVPGRAKLDIAHNPLMSADIQPADFADAVAKGLGRAVLWMRQGAYQPSFNQLRRWVLRWQGYDGLMSSYRGVYCADLIETSIHRDQITETLYASLDAKGENLNQKQRIRTVMELGLRGDERALGVLKASFDPAESRWIAADPIARLGGIAGVEWIVERVRPFYTEESWELSAWLEEGAKNDGQEAVDLWKDLPAQAWVRTQLADRKRPPKEKLLPVPFETFLADTGRQPGDWASTASIAEIEKAAAALPTLPDEESFRRVMRAVRFRSNRIDIGLLLEILPQIPEAHVCWLYDLLDDFTGPRIRALGFEIFETDPVRGSSLLRRNIVADEIPMIGELLDKLTHEDDLHSVGLDLISISDSFPIHIWLRKLYDVTPCSFCRDSVIYKLTTAGEAPKEILEECLWDAEPDIRTDAWAALQVG